MRVVCRRHLRSRGLHLVFLLVGHFVHRNPGSDGRISAAAAAADETKCQGRDDKQSANSTDNAAYDCACVTVRGSGL